MKTNYCLSTLMSLMLVSNLIAQNRVDRPIQLQVNFSGAFIKVAANRIADPSVDDVKVNSRKPGISIGYHINRYLYLGYSISPSLDLTLSEKWGFTGFGQDGNIVLDHQTGTIYILETRFTPFNIGFYLSAAYAHLGKTNYSMKFRRLFETMKIGDNFYATDLDVDWKSESLNQISLGFGYNHVFNSGLSFNPGISVPLKFPDNESVDFMAVNNTGGNISTSDLQHAEKFLSEETFYGPIVLYLNIGYNLKNLKILGRSD